MNLDLKFDFESENASGFSFEDGDDNEIDIQKVLDEQLVCI